MKTIYLVDGSSFAYRAFYAIGHLSTQKGQPTNAVYGFTRILNRLIDKYKPEYIAVAFDIGKPTFRHEQYEAYKAHRKPMPDELVGQIPWIKKTIAAYNIPLIEMEGYEADDIIATMAVRAEREGFRVYVVTGDKDMMQLVNSNIMILNPSKEDLIYNEKEVAEKYGVTPEKITQFLALTGDSSDNIPGVPGVGEKTAGRLIQQYGSIDGILNNLNDLSPKLKAALEENKERIAENLSLVTIKKDMEINIQTEDCVLKEPNVNMLKDIFRELEFRALLKELLEKKGIEPASSQSLDELQITTLVQWSGIVNELRSISAISITEDKLAYEKNGSLISICFSSATPEILDQVWKDLSDTLRNPDIKKYGYNLKSILRKRNINIQGSFFDAYIAEALVNEYPIEEGQNLALNVYKAIPDLEKKLLNERLFDLYHRIELPLIEILADMESCGINLDVKFLKALSQDLERDLLRLTEKIYEIAGESFNINSPKQLENILFNKLNLPKGRRTKTGYSTDIDVLENLAKHHELPKYIVEYRQLNKLKGTYIDPLPELLDPKTNRLHTTFNQVGTVTGRLSSSNPNLQNIPAKTELGRRIRKAFIPGKDNFVFLGADYSQIELRVLAHLSGDKLLIKAFQEDKDIHTQTAQEIFGVEDVTPDLRRQAKVVNFGILYGMGAKSMAAGLGISVEDAQKFIDRYFERYINVAEYVNNELRTAKELGYVVTMFGRKRKVPELASSRPQEEALGRRIAINTPIQGSAADIIKIAMINIHKKIRENKLDAKMLLQIHDELIFEAPEDSIEQLEQFVRKEMEGAVQLSVPLKVDIKVGRSWADL